MALNVQLLRDSFEQAKPIANEIADKFYELLWQDYPSSSELFNNIEMDKQKKALINSLVFIVDNLENGDELKDYLMKMGTRHLEYGVEEEHYEWVGASLLKSFSYFFGDDWSDDLNSQWLEAYQFIAQTMQEGAKASVKENISSHLIVEKAHHIAQKLIYEVIDESFNEEMIDYIRKKVRHLMYEVLEEESSQLMKKNAA